MHPHAIDWFRTVHLNSDATLAERRWKAAEDYAKTLSRTSVLQLLRLFLFATPTPEQAKLFTDELLKLDKEFPVTGNTEELRLMAGIVMITTFGKSSVTGDAFALGLDSAAFSDRAMQPAQPAIIAEAKSYLLAEAERQRPSDFDEPPAIDPSTLATKYAAMKEAEASGEAPKIQAAQAAYHKAVAKSVQDNNDALTAQIRRLAEESNLLWWVLGEYSTSLKRRTETLGAEDYALAAASEAAQRTHILPPPSSADALLARALKACKPVTKKKPVLADFLTASDATWRAHLLKDLNFSDCGDFVPILTALGKYEESQDAASAVGLLPKL